MYIDKYKVIKNELGYYEIENKPTEEELNKHYSEKYYQLELEYKNNYNEEELQYFQNMAKRIYNVVKNNNIKTFLDIGCGEGFYSNYFNKMGYECTCLDYSNYGIKNHNPNLLNNFIKGNIYKNLDDLIKNNKKFGVIIMKSCFGTCY